MNLLAWNRTSLALAAALTTMVAAPGGADAFWASHGSYGSYGSRGSYGSYASGGSYGSYASSGSYGSYASSGSHGSSASYGSYGPGPFKRLAMHIRAKHSSHGSSGGSYASSGSHGSSGGSSGGTVTYHYSTASTGSHGSSGASSGGYSSAGSHGGYSSVYASSPTVVSSSRVIVASKPVAPSVPVETTIGSAMLRVSVPVDAVVYVNDRKTTSTGSQRQYVSNGLKSGESYTYRVRVEFEQDGESKTMTKQVRLTAGSDELLAFAEPTSAPVVADDDESDEEEEAKPVTKLTLRVPADAQVTLAGAATEQTGAEREFVTTRLQAGATWEDYTVRVETTVEGKPVVQERVITLRGGESQALIFNFSDATLAALN